MQKKRGDKGRILLAFAVIALILTLILIFQGILTGKAIENKPIGDISGTWEFEDIRGPEYIKFSIELKQDFNEINIKKISAYTGGRGAVLMYEGPVLKSKGTLYGNKLDFSWAFPGEGREILSTLSTDFIVAPDCNTIEGDMEWAEYSSIKDYLLKGKADEHGIN
ncbi:unnamed protein product, partial [marine sediment metagenome]